MVVVVDRITDPAIFKLTMFLNRYGWIKLASPQNTAKIRYKDTSYLLFFISSEDQRFRGEFPVPSPRLWYLSCYKQVTGQMCGGGLHRPTGWQSGGRCSFQTFTVWYPWYVTSHTYQVTHVQCVTSLVTHVSGISGMCMVCYIPGYTHTHVFAIWGMGLKVQV